MKKHLPIALPLILVLVSLFLFLYAREKALAPSTRTETPKENIMLSKYTNTDPSFTASYPASYRVKTNYTYDLMGEGKALAGIKFLIPTETATGTNLSSYDSGVSIEYLSKKETTCTASAFIYGAPRTEDISLNNIQYSVATSSGAGAGNFYEETVWAIKGSSPCIAVRYFIHSMNIYNYPPGIVREFDRAKLLREFDVVRDSLAITQAR